MSDPSYFIYRRNGVLVETKAKNDIEDFFKRRHRIVHHADRNLESGQGQHGARAIKVETVNKWKQEIDEIISKLFTEAKTKISI